MENNIQELLEKLTIVETNLDPKETKTPTESDLDDIFDAVNTLNKCEFFVTTAEELKILIQAQEILNKLL